MLTDDAKFKNLCDHYKDTFSHIRDYLKLRDWLFILILAALTLMAFQVLSPTESGEAISQFIAKKLELAKPIDISFVGSVTWFALLFLIVRYYQVVILIERQYNYIHSIENQISQYYSNGIFTREGTSYLSNYPLFSDWTSILYTIIFPILLLIVVIFKIVGEWRQAPALSIPLFFNTASLLCILISSILYMLAVHYKKCL